MIKKMFFLSTFALIALLICSCHKYPNDPFFSFKRPERRIQGSYILVHYYVNGIDSAYNSKFSYYTTGSHINVPHDPLALYKSDLHLEWSSSSGSGGTAISFMNKERFLYANFSLFVRGAFLWKILKLTSKEVWLTLSSNGNVYEIHLRKT